MGSVVRQVESALSCLTRTRLSSSLRATFFPNQDYKFARENPTQKAAYRFLASLEFLRRVCGNPIMSVQ